MSRRQDIMPGVLELDLDAIDPIAGVLCGARVWALHEGDALDLRLPPECADALIMDPPAGIRFMGKAWDSDKGGEEQWVAWLASILRVAFGALKPGAHALVWSLPRTSDWTGQALRKAGFIIRDTIDHVSGSGFPKSLDISKAIDAAAGAKREPIGSIRKTESFGCANAVLGDGPPKNGQMAITAPATPEAKRWAGWGTALRPNKEVWWLAMKPRDKGLTIAANVLRHGVGGLNIDAARVGNTGLVMGHLLHSFSWGQERYLCASCARRAERHEKHEAPASKAYTATKNVEPTSNVGGEHVLSDSSKTDTGCYPGRSPAGPRDAPVKDSSSSTEPSGSSTTGRSLTGTSSTTSTRTRPTIGSTTCSSCGVAITPACTSEISTNTQRNQRAPTTTPPGKLITQNGASVTLSSNVSEESASGRWPSNCTFQHSSWDESECRACGVVVPFVTRFCPACGSGDIEAKRGGCRCVGEREVLIHGQRVLSPKKISGGAGYGGGWGVYASDATKYANEDGLETVGAWECLATCERCGESALVPSGGDAGRCACGFGRRWACAVALLDEHSGSRSSGARAAGVRTGAGYGGPAIEASEGSASRFFHCFPPEPFEPPPCVYSPKPSTAEREAGLSGEAGGAPLSRKNGGELTGREEGSAGLDNPRSGAQHKGARANDHPTIKGFHLLGHLLDLVVPPGGLVLDLTAGSGTLGAVVAHRHQATGWRCIMAEIDAGHCRIIRERCKYWGARPWRPRGKSVPRMASTKAAAPVEQASLFTTTEGR